MGSAHHLHVVHPRGVPPRTVVPLLLGAGIEFPAEPQPVGGLATPGPSFFELQKQPRGNKTELGSLRGERLYFSRFARRRRKMRPSLPSGTRAFDVSFEAAYLGRARAE